MSDDACYADDIGDYRWEGFPLAQKFGWMQTGQGAGAVQPAVDALRGLSARYTESHRAVHAQLARLGVSWRGASADAAAAATTRLADWVSGAGQTVTGGGGSMESYGASFTALKPNIPPPPDVGAQSSAGHALDSATGGYGALVGLQSDHSRRLAAAAALDAQANAALTEHQQATRAALQSFPPAAEPPVLAAGTGPAGGGVPGGGSGVSAPGGAGAAPGSGASPGAGAPTPSEGSTGPGGAGAGGTGPGGAGPGGTGPGGTGPGAGAGTEGAAAPTVNAAWTPLTPPAGQPGGASSGPLPGSHGGPIAAPPPYRPSATPGAHGGRIGGSAAAGGYGGGRPGGFGPAPPARGGPPPGSPSGPSGGADPGASRAAAGRGPGMGGLAGMPPLGMGGGVGGQERSHRNQTFIPSDEPFQVEHFDISPPVLGVRCAEDDW